MACSSVVQLAGISPSRDCDQPNATNTNAQRSPDDPAQTHSTFPLDPRNRNVTDVETTFNDLNLDSEPVVPQTVELIRGFDSPNLVDGVREQNMILHQVNSTLRREKWETKAEAEKFRRENMAIRLDNTEIRKQKETISSKLEAIEERNRLLLSQITVAVECLNGAENSLRERIMFFDGPDLTSILEDVSLTREMLASAEAAQDSTTEL